MALPVTVYMAVLGAMVCAALLAALPTPWTALGAVCFAASDSMIGISKFVLGSEALAVPIWWAYAASLFLITTSFTTSAGSAISASGGTASYKGDADPPRRRTRADSAGPAPCCPCRTWTATSITSSAPNSPTTPNRACG